MIAFRPYSPEWANAVREFNARIASSGFDLPPDLATNATLAVEDHQHVRGSYILRPQTFSLEGQSRTVAHYRLPLSEGTVNRTYAMLGVQLLRHALQQQPLLYALGMGGIDKPLPKMLKASGWMLHPVPFHFKVVRPHAFLRQIRPLRKIAWRRLAMDAAAWTGLGWLGLRLLQPRVSAASIPDLVPQFDDRENTVWQTCLAEYPVLAARDSCVLNTLYADRKFHRLRTADGWAVALDTRMQDDPYFGNMRVATIVDGLAPLPRVPHLITAVTRFLEQRGVDLIISNQAHRTWNAALQSAGFRTGPTNFVFAASKQLAARITDPETLHINRGDGDGPIHL